MQRASAKALSEHCFVTEARPSSRWAAIVAGLCELNDPDKASDSEYEESSDDEAARYLWAAAHSRLCFSVVTAWAPV